MQKLNKIIIQLSPQDIFLFALVTYAILTHECQLLHQNCPFRQLSKGKSALQQLNLVPDPMRGSCTAAASIEIPSERSAVAAAAGARILHPLAME